MVMRYPQGRTGRELRLGYKHHVEAPESTEKCTIFPVDKTKGEFSMDFYDPEITRGRISCEEIARFLREIDPIVKPMFHPRINLFFKCFDKVQTFWVFGCVGLLFLGAFLERYVGPVYFSVLWFIFMGFFISTALVLIFNCVYVAIVKYLLRKSRDKVIPIVQAKNPDFQRKGYSWVVPEIYFPYWIELWEEGSGIVNIEQQYEGDQEMQNYGRNPLNSQMRDEYIELT